MPAQTHAGAVGGQLLGAIGSAVDIAAAIGYGLGTVLNFIVPGIGSLIGTIIGTLLGDAFGSTPHPAAIDLIDQAGYLYGFSHYQTSASDGGSYNIPDPMATAAVSIVNAYLTAVKGAALDHSKQVTLGYMTDPAQFYINGTPGHTNGGFLIADYAVHAAALDVLQNIEVIGGDLLLEACPPGLAVDLSAAPASARHHAIERRPGADRHHADTIAALGGRTDRHHERRPQRRAGLRILFNNREAINALMAVYPDFGFYRGLDCNLC